MKAAKVEAFEIALGQSTAATSLDSHVRHPLRDASATISRFPSSPATTSRTRTARASCTRRPVMAARTSTSGRRTRPSCSSAASTPTIPFTVDGDGRFTKDAPGFEGKRVIDDKGNKGDANDAVIKALVEANALIARGRLKHQYPHSWRSKKPVIFRNTPQWFIAMDKPLRLPPPLAPPRKGEGGTCRAQACKESRAVRRQPDAARGGRCRPSPRPSSCRPRARTACAA